jgi:hypothetical protein
MDEVAAALGQITGLNVFAYPPPRITPNAGYLDYPQSVDFDQEYQRGGDRITDLPIVLVTSRLTDLTARDTVAAWTSGSGPKSVKAALEKRSWTSCDDLTVTSVEFDFAPIGDVPYLVAIFKATAVGPGED